MMNNAVETQRSEGKISASSNGSNGSNGSKSGDFDDDELQYLHMSQP